MNRTMLNFTIRLLMAAFVGFYSTHARADQPKITPEIVRQTKLRATAGSVIDQNNLGCYYQTGSGVAEDDTEASVWFLSAAKSGLASAQYNFARCLMEGEGTQKNMPLAIQWLTKAALSGHARSQVELGLAYGRGTGLPQDHKMAVKWFRVAAEAGYKWAQYDLSVCYRNGEGVKKDPSESLNWLRKAATAGLAIAQKDLGYVYADGDGVPKNQVAAVYWWRKGAENGDPASQHNLAFALSEGSGCKQDRQEALVWYRKAASAGLRDSQNNLGYAYQIGEGLPKNFLEAYAWTSLSAGQGYQNAILEMPNLEKLVTPAERAQALDRAREIQTKISSGEIVSEPGVPLPPVVTLPPLQVPKFESYPDRNAILSRAGGTGYFITDAAHVLTCAHVIKGAKRVWIQQGAEMPCAMRILKTDTKNDLALLAPENKNTIKAIPILLARVVSRVGEAVFTIGFPNTDIQGLTAKVTDGRISSSAGFEDDPTQFQISVAVQPGNSGGPLLNMQGEVVGTVQSILSGNRMFKAGAEIPQSVSYAVKIGQAQGVLEGLSLPTPSSDSKPSNQGIDSLPSLVESAMPSVVLVLVE